MVIPSLPQHNMMATETSSTTVVANGLSCGFREGNAQEYYLQDETMMSEHQMFPLHQILEDYSLRSFDRDDAAAMEHQIKELIDENPILLDEFNDRGLTALHVACTEGASLAVIEALVAGNPSSIYTPTKNKKKLLPFHLLCRYYSGPMATMNAIVQLLMDVYPDSVKIPTGSGELALHLCLQNPFCTVSLLQTVIQAFPEAVQARTTRKRQLPLHLACERQYCHRLGKKESAFGGNTSDAIIRFLVHLNAEALMCSDTKGFLPIHSAVQGYQTPSTLKFLLSVYPDSIQFVDAKGRTPLHICVTNALADMATASVLLAADPSATSVQDDHLNIPLHYAAQGGQLDLIFALTLTSPTSLDILRNKL